MKLTFWPKSRLGKWAVGFIVYDFLAFGLMRVLVAFGEQGGEGFFSNFKLAFSGLSIVVAGILALFFGIESIIKAKERSILVFPATFIGFSIFIFVLSEILSPH